MRVYAASPLSGCGAADGATPATGEVGLDLEAGLALAVVTGATGSGFGTTSSGFKSGVGAGVLGPK